MQDLYQTYLLDHDLRNRLFLLVQILLGGEGREMGKRGGERREGGGRESKTGKSEEMWKRGGV